MSSNTLTVIQVSHLTWNPPLQHATASAAAASEVQGKEFVLMQNIAIAC
jgi:hypothetical protein